MLVVVPATRGGAHRPGCMQRGRHAEAERPRIEALGLPGAVAPRARSDEGRRNGATA
jgi:hypothetical protein